MSNELRRELAAPAEDVAPRLVDDIQLLAVEGFHCLNSLAAGSEQRLLARILNGNFKLLAQCLPGGNLGVKEAEIVNDKML